MAWSEINNFFEITRYETVYDSTMPRVELPRAIMHVEHEYIKVAR